MTLFFVSGVCNDEISSLKKVESHQFFSQTSRKHLHCFQSNAYTFTNILGLSNQSGTFRMRNNILLFKQRNIRSFSCSSALLHKKHAQSHSNFSRNIQNRRNPAILRRMVFLVQKILSTLQAIIFTHPRCQPNP